ncbi:ABC transporter permease [Actinoplanes sp. NPDC051861]|uniref:ABC transporter permease n=1 Tax=Actinoplanes sp. NPDC051861 TaxID=3155170 RepID=UPI0034257CA7
MGAVLRRVRAYAAHLGLLAVLSLVAALLFAGGPRAANGFTDEGLRAEIAALPHEARDLTYRAAPSGAPSAAESALPAREQALPGPLRNLVSDRWFAGSVGPGNIERSGPPPYSGACSPELRVRYQTGWAREVRLVSGRLPAPGDATEAVVEAAAADAGNLHESARVRLTGAAGSVTLTVVGVFERADPASPFWDGLATVPVICPDPREGDTVRITLLTDLAGIARAGHATGVLAYEWRYALDPGRFRASGLTAVSTAVAAARRVASSGETSLDTGVDSALGDFEERLSGVRALLALVRAGLAATVLGLIVMASGLLVQRRREEFALLRARGASGGAVVRRTLAETAVVVPAALAAGWGLSLLVPGRPDPVDGVLIALAGLVALLSAPLLAARSGRHRRAAPARRVTGELLVVLLAVAGVVLARRRGLGADPYLVSVPVLLGAAAALLLVRMLPLPLQRMGLLARRSRGLVPFLGLAHAGRGAAVGAGPLAILVVAVVTGVFVAAVSGTVRDARDRATDLEIAADARVDGFAFAPDTSRALTALPGVRAVTPALLEGGAALTGETGRRTQAQVMVSAAVPETVVSPQVAAEIGSGGTIVVQGRRYEFRVAGVAETVRGLPPNARRFVALPWNALPVPEFQPLIPNRFLVEGQGFSVPALREAADEGQRANLSRVLGHAVRVDALAQRASVTTWDQHRDALGRGGVNGVLDFTYAAGAIAAAVLALLAVALTLLAGAPGRRETIARLRTMGLAARQGRQLLVVEVVPVVVAALAAGGLAGSLLPWLLGGALNIR